MNGLRERKRTSWHLADLQDKSAADLSNVLNQLNVTPSDTARNPAAVTVARFTAAKMIADSWEAKSAPLYNLVLERTEGKVPDLRVNFQGDAIIERLERARARLNGDITPAELAETSAVPIDGTIEQDQLEPACIYNEASGNDVPRGTLSGVDDITAETEPSDTSNTQGSTEVSTSITLPVAPCPETPTPRGDPGSIDRGGGSGEPRPGATIAVRKTSVGTREYVRAEYIREKARSDAKRAARADAARAKAEAARPVHRNKRTLDAYLRMQKLAQNDIT